MNHLLNITKKELKELLTAGSVMSIVIVVLMMVAVGTMIGGEMEDVSSPSKVGFVNGDPNGSYSDETSEYLLDFYMGAYKLTEDEARDYIIMLDSPYGDNSAIVDEMRNRGLTAALGIGPDYSDNLEKKITGTISEYYIFESSGMMNSTSSSISPVIINYISDRFSKILIDDATDEPETTSFLIKPVNGNSQYTYVNGQVHAGVTPYEISTSMMSQKLMIPIIIMIVIMMVGSIVISSMGNEKENKTLETLLTLPVKRTTIVSGKLLASAIVGLLFGLAYLVGMLFYMNGLTSAMSGINLSDYGLSLGVYDWAVIMVMIFLSIMCALGLCMILGAFVKNYKAAQTMTLPIGILAMIPMFLTLFSSWDALPASIQAIMFAIPFSHPMMIMENLMFGNFEIVAAGLVYLVAFMAVTIILTVKIYKSDILITGAGQMKIVRIFKTMITKRKPQ